MTTEAIDTASPEQAELDNASSQIQEDVSETETTTEEKTQEAAGEETQEVWPDKAVKAHAEQKRRAIRLKMENKQLRDQLSQLQQAQQAIKPQQAPEIVQFDTYDEYVDALTDYKISQKLNEGEKARLQQQQENVEANWVVKREVEIAERAKEFRAQASDYDVVLQEVTPIVSQFPPDLERLVMSLEDPVVAIYNLQKEDRLLDLLDKAEAKGFTAKKPVTAAPAPLRAVKGSGSPNQTLSRLADDPKKLMEWYRQR
jgi:hypothetical protein